MLYRYIVAVSVLWSVSMHADCAGHTVFVPRSITHDATYELAISNYEFYHPQTKALYNLYFTPLYQQSFHGSKNAPYFLLNGKRCIDFAQDGTGDVNPMWLDLISGDHGENFSSTICAVPHRKVYGLHIAWFLNFDDYVNGLWMEVATAILGSAQKINLCETNIQGNSDTLIPGISNGIQALTNPALLHGRFSNCTLKTGGLDDIQIKLGWNKFYREEVDHIGPYGVITIPTGHLPHDTFIFEPRIGTHNVALGFGINGDYGFWHDEYSTFHIMSDFKYRFLFKSHECRSFDLCKNGPWSRYLQVVSSDQRSNPMPGINSCFTQKAGVTPRSQIDWWTALHWARDRNHLEIGWNFWYRQSEKVKTCGSCPFGIYDLGADAQRQNARHEQIREPISASNATISESVFPPNAVPSDSVFTTVHGFSDKSGAHPTAISNKVYAAWAYDTYIRHIPMFFGLGCSVEIGHGISALSYWAAWAKVGLTI